MDELLTHEDFKVALDQSFDLSDDDTRLPLTLIEVKRLRGPQREEDKRDQFSLLFKGPHSPLMPQRMYALRNDTMGELTMFLVPVGRADGQHQNAEAEVLYEAVFT